MFEEFPVHGTDRIQVRFFRGLLQKEQPFFVDFQCVIREAWIDSPEHLLSASAVDLLLL